jgi:hypothetical protein
MIWTFTDAKRSTDIARNMTGGYREFRPYLNQHRCGTLIADLIDAHWFPCWQAHRSPKDWQSLPRPVVERIQVQGVRVAKESGFDQKNFGRVDQGEAAFPLKEGKPRLSRTNQNPQHTHLAAV